MKVQYVPDLSCVVSCKSATTTTSESDPHSYEPTNAVAMKAQKKFLRLRQDLGLKFVSGLSLQLL